MSDLGKSVGPLLSLLLVLGGMLGACGSATDVVPEATPAQGGDADPLAATSWRLATLGEQDVLPGTFGTAIFGEFNNLSGYAGCNDFSATYLIDGDQISITALVPSAIACNQPEAVSEQERVFLAFLENASRYQAGGDELVLDSVDGTKTLTFVSAPPVPLQGTHWTLHSANDLQGAVVNPISGTKITALFAEDGTLSGSAGCNSYTAPYEVDADTVSIGPATATEKYCSEPEGIMDQEAAFLQLLASASLVENLADYMALSNEEGDRVLIFAASTGGE